MYIKRFLEIILMKKILIVKGNLEKKIKFFSGAGIQTHTESLKDSLAYFTDKLETHVVNPSSDENMIKILMHSKVTMVLFGVE
ncbi:MAG: hypothetical protein CM1200mP13_16360 [Candidatus Pelagibacterales bacterium]|nr:MAG: hypothetical protein CM1200mP13_16360 [Pelagibacterales bacterium]